MLDAKKAKESTVIDFERADIIEENTCTNIEDAAKKGMKHVTAWVYDRYEGRWLGDVPDAVIEELERRFIAAGYELEWQGKNGYMARVIKW